VGSVHARRAGNGAHRKGRFHTIQALRIVCAGRTGLPAQFSQTTLIVMLIFCKALLLLIAWLTEFKLTQFPDG
jgi:hypothetical protein